LPGGEFALSWPLARHNERGYNRLHWIAPTEKDAADQFSSNSGLKPNEYSGSILSPIFLHFAEVRFIVGGVDHE